MHGVRCHHAADRHQGVRGRAGPARSARRRGAFRVPRRRRPGRARPTPQGAGRPGDGGGAAPGVRAGARDPGGARLGLSPGLLLSPRSTKDEPPWDFGDEEDADALSSRRSRTAAQSLLGLVHKVAERERAPRDCRRSREAASGRSCCPARLGLRPVVDPDPGPRDSGAEQRHGRRGDADRPRPADGGGARSGGGAQSRCVSQLRQHRHDPKSWLRKRVGELGPKKLDELARAVRIAVDVAEPARDRDEYGAGELSPVEQALDAAVETGRAVNLTGAADPVVRAEVLREAAGRRGCPPAAAAADRRRGGRPSRPRGHPDRGAAADAAAARSPSGCGCAAPTSPCSTCAARGGVGCR